MNKFFKYSLPIGIAGIALNLLLLATNWYYELVIPVFEKTMEDGPAFTFIDHVVYFTPVFMMVLFAAYIVVGQIYMKNHHEKVEEKVTEQVIEKNEKIQKELDAKAEFLKHKYYTNCPKCGAPREENKAECSFCGASLIMDKKTDKKS